MSGHDPQQPEQTPPTYGQPQPAQPGDQSGQPGGYGYPTQYGYQSYGGHAATPGGYAGPPQEHPRSTTALVLGIVGLVGSFVCGVPAVLGPFAWWLGARTKREIDAAPGRFGGRDKASAGMILGIVTTVLLVLSILALIAFFVIIASVGVQYDESTTF